MLLAVYKLLFLFFSLARLMAALFMIDDMNFRSARLMMMYLEQEKRSVSDYMGGHHAGKFDFDSRISGVTALNYEKSAL